MNIDNEIQSLMVSIEEIREVNVTDFIDFIDASINSSSEILTE